MRYLRSLLDTYGLPHRVPFAIRVVVLMLLFPGVGVVIWLLAPHTPAMVGILVVYALLAVGLGLWRLSRAEELSRPPGRNPQPPPSIHPR